MPVAPVDNKGTYLYYEDSGPPAGSNTYVTLVCAHGAMFHSPVFRPLLPYADKHNMRLVFVNLRDYPGSSPFTPADLAALREVDSQAVEIQTRGREIAHFLAWFVEKEAIPPVRRAEDGTRAGGLAVLGWSAGNMTTVSFLAHADTLPERTKSLLGSYMRTLVLYDASSTALGIPFPEGLYIYNPRRDPSLNDEQKAARFAPFVSAYFPPVDNVSSPDIPEIIVPRKPLHTLSADDPLYKSPSTSRMTPAEFAAMADHGVVTRSQNLVMNINRDVLYGNFRRAVFTSAGNAVWPEVDVALVWCNASVGECLLATHVILKEYNHLTGEDYRGRPMRFSKLEGNHFAHWDEPEKTMDCLASFL